VPNRFLSRTTCTGAYAALLVFRNPYIYAVLTVLTILPQNSNVTSLNNLVLLFYESGLFMNFAEAVTCVRLVTWLSMGFMRCQLCTHQMMDRPLA